MNISELISKLEQVRDVDPDAIVLVRGPSGYLDVPHSVQAPAGKNEKHEYAIEIREDCFGFPV